MTDTKQEFPVVTDPGNVPVVFFDQVLASGQFAGVVNVTLGVARFTPIADGKIDPDVIVAGRLRMNMVAAMQMRSELDRVIALAEATMKQTLTTALVSTAAPGKSGKSN